MSLSWQRMAKPPTDTDKEKCIKKFGDSDNFDKLQSHASVRDTAEKLFEESLSTKNQKTL